MTREEIIEQLNLTIGLIKQDGKDWLDDRDIPMLEECVKVLSQEPCDDAISRSDMFDAIGHGTTYTSEELQRVIQNLPPVTQKSGKWTLMYEPKNMAVCSECGKCAYMYRDKMSVFCPHCGAKMVESQESEEIK